jgi:hypothetical protein
VLAVLDINLATLKALLPLVYILYCLCQCILIVFSAIRLEESGKFGFVVIERGQTVCRPDRLWGPSSLLSNGQRELASRDKVAGT